MPLPTHDDALREAYAQNSKPRLAEVLAAVGLDIVYRRGSGCYLEYEKGGESIQVLDFLAGYGAGLMGHHHPELAAIARANLEEGVPTHAQASSRGWSALLSEELSRMLWKVTDREFVIHLLSTGTEVVEAAVHHCELARRTRLRNRELETEKAWRALMEEMAAADQEERRAFVEATVKLNPALAGVDSLNGIMRKVTALNREVVQTEPVFLALEGSYHGSGSAAGKLSYGRRYHSTMSLTGIRVRFVPPSRPDQLESLIEEHSVRFLEPARDSDGGWYPRLVQQPIIAALFLEVIQGEGGIQVLDREDLRNLHRICRHHRIPVVADEIQTGLGRTGSMFACEQVGLQPEVVLLSKVLGGSLAKVAALAVCVEEYVDDFSMAHSSTFAEDDPSSRIALGVLELLERDDRALLKRCRELGERLVDGLKDLQKRWPEVLGEVRGHGLMVGLEFASMDLNPSATLRGFELGGALAAVASGWLLHERGIRVAPALRHSRTIRLQPPATVTEEEIDRTLAAFADLLELFDRGDIIGLTRFLHQDDAAEGSSEEQDRWVPKPDLDFGTAYAVAHAPEEKTRPRIAFFSHFIDAPSVRDWDPALRALSDDGAHRLVRRMEGWTSHFPMRRFVTRSITGEEVDGVIFGWPVMPEGYMAALRDRRLYTRMVDDIRDALTEAAGEGCGWAGFGGFTSILTRSCTAVRNDEIRVTSGNSLTAGMAAAAVLRASQEIGLNLADETVAIIGAAGNLGRIQAHLLRPEVGNILLVGRPGSENRLHRIAAELLEGSPLGAEVSITTDLQRLKECRVLVTASNATKPIVYPEHVIEGPSVFLDVSVPGDAAPDLQDARPEMRLLRGGIVRLPNGPVESRLHLPGWHLPDGHAYACLAETILLGLEQLDADYSCGPVSPERVREIMRIAGKHGFELGNYQLRPSL